MNYSMFESAVAMVRRLRQSGFEAYLAGGCVRNRIMGIEPKDFDIATNALPDEVVRLFPRTVPVGKAFGVILVLQGPDTFEVATFRSDGRYIDGRHPEKVTFSDIQTDAQRRDFTINGMFYDPLEDRLIDLVGGREDIQKKIIRTIGDPIRRFEEDKLRMMRAVRFSCQLGFDIEESTLAAIRALSSKITQVSFERIRDELKYILVSPRRAWGLDQLHRLGLLIHILPEIAAMEGVQQPPEFHPEGDVFVHSKLCLEKLEDPDFVVALATLLHDVGKPPTFTVSDRIRFNAHEKVGERMARRICQRLHLSREETDKVCWMVSHHMMFKDLPQMRDSTLRRFLASEHFADLEKLFKADKLASDGDMELYRYLKAVQEKFSHEVLKPPPLIRGQDLLDLGFQPGPRFGQILTAVEDAQLEGRVRTKEEALEMARSLALKT